RLLLEERFERGQDLLRRDGDVLELARRQPPVVADRRVADELADLLRVLRRDLLNEVDEHAARQPARLLARRQRLLLGPVLELARGDVEQVADARGDSLEEPDVRDRRRQVDVAHALAPNLLPRHLDAAALADDPLVADALVLAAVALPVLRRTEDAFAEETVALRLERPVVDRLGLRHLARGPVADLLARGKPDPDRIEVVDVDQSVLAPLSIP